MEIKVDLFTQIQKRETQIGRNLSNREIAHFTGIHETTVSAYRLRKVKMVRLDTLAKFVQYFECTPGELFSMKEAV